MTHPTRPLRLQLRLRLRLFAVLVAAAAAVALGGATGALRAGLARADGDPASDVLLGQDVYYPYSPSVSAALQGRLGRLTAAARRSGYPVKVAIIDSPTDLGVVPDLFRRPQKYADFLVQEISFQGRQHLLVVMPNGYGVQGASPAAVRTVGALAKPAGATSDDLARAAIPAVESLTKLAGHPVTDAGAGGTSGSGGSTAIIVAVLAAVALAAIAGLLVLRRRTPAG